MAIALTGYLLAVPVMCNDTLYHFGADSSGIGIRILNGVKRAASEPQPALPWAISPYFSLTFFFNFTACVA